MPRARKTTASTPRRRTPAKPADVQATKDAEPGTPDPGSADTPGSEEVQVILPAADEPVRCGGHVLTDAGWVVEDGGPVPDDADDQGEPAPETEEE